MSEYWQSTPRIWCKHCKAFYRDTPLDTRQHNATGKHQSAVQRAIRNLHKTTEREERNAQRAKAEVERLNGVVSGKPVSKPLRSTNGGAAGGAESASEGDRKRQIAQLAAMGVAVPEEYRREMALASDWSTISTRSLEAVKEDGVDVKGEDQEGWEASRGVRRRRDEDEEDEGDVPNGGNAGGARRENLAWGRRVKRYEETEVDVDIAGLMGSGTEQKTENKGGDLKKDDDENVKEEEGAEEAKGETAGSAAVNGSEEIAVKGEEVEAPPMEKAVVFKKRKKAKAGG